MHRRRINTEEKAKVVADVWGTEFVQFLCRTNCFALGRFEKQNELHQNDMKKKMNSSYS